MARVLAVWVLFAFVLGCSKSPSELSESAKRLIARGETSAAIIELREAIRLSPTDGVLRLELAEAYNSRFDGVFAEKELQKANELGVIAGGRVAVEMARALQYQRKHKEVLARVVVNQVFEPGQKAKIHSLRGMSYLNVGQMKEASSELAHAKQLDSLGSDTRILEALLKLSVGENDAAVTILEDVSRGAPQRLDAKLMLASIFRSNGQIERAIREFDDVLIAVPEHYQALVGRSTLFAVSREFDKAEADVMTLLKNYKGWPQPYIQKAYVQILRGQYQAALESAQIALKATPEPTQALLLLGISHRALGQHLQAEVALSRYVSQVPRDTTGRTILAETLVSTNQPKRALSVLEPLLRVSSASAETLAIAGQAYGQLGDFTRAQELYERAVISSPKDPGIRVRRSLVYMQGGDVDAGLKELAIASNEMSKVGRIDEVLVLTLLQRGDVTGAEKVVEGLVGRAPSNPISMNLNALLFLRKNDDNSARRILEQCVKSNPQFVPAILNLAQLDVRRGDIASAVSRYDLAISAGAASLQVLLAKGKLLLGIGKRDEAIETFEKGVRAYPGALESYEGLVKLYSETGQHSRALDVAQRAVNNNPEVVAALVFAARTQISAGSFGQAVQNLSKAARIEPRSITSHVLLAEAKSGAGDKSGAEEVLRRILRSSPDSYGAQAPLFWFLVQGGRLEEASRLADDIISRTPKSGNGYVFSGQVLEEQKKWQEALSVYRRGLNADSARADLAIRIFQITRQLGDTGAAQKNLNEWVRRNSNDVGARRLLAHSFLETGDHKRALEEFRNLLSRHPRDPDAMNGIAWALYVLGDNSALGYARAAYYLDPTYAYAVDTFGWLLVQEKKFTEGLSLLKRASRLMPNDPTIKYHLAFGLNASGQRDKAVQELKIALASSNNFPEREAALKLLGSLR